jgi:cobalt-zinc-cadmium efflux system protein
MLRSAYGLLRDSGRIFLEASPKGIDPNRIGRRMAEQAGVVEVHDLHVWEVTSEFPALSAHVTVTPDTDCHRTRLELGELIERQFGIRHTTLQVEHEPEHLVQIEE